MSTHELYRTHAVVSCTIDLFQLCTPPALHMNMYLSLGNPGQKRTVWAHCCLQHLSGDMLQITAAFPSTPWHCQVLLRRGGMPCCCPQQSSGFRAHTVLQTTKPGYIFSHAKLTFQVLPFYWGACNICGSHSWTSTLTGLWENCKFSFKRKVFLIRTMQLRKCKLSVNLTPDYSLSKHVE